MSERMKPILGALVTAYIVFYVSVTYFFGPILANDAPAGPMMPTWASLAVVVRFPHFALRLGERFRGKSDPLGLDRCPFADCSGGRPLCVERHAWDRRRRSERRRADCRMDSGRVRLR